MNHLQGRLILVTLLVTLAAGSYWEHLRHRQRVAGLEAAGPLTRYSSALSAAYSSEVTWREELRAMLNDTGAPPVPPPVPYNRETSLRLIRACRLAVTQFRTGRKFPDYDGDLAALENYDRFFSGSTQLVSFRADQESFEQYFQMVEPVPGGVGNRLPDRSNSLRRALQETIPNIVGRRYRQTVFFGYLIETDRDYLLVFRGTQTKAEWINNLRSTQRRYPRDASREGLGKVHLGFLSIVSGETPFSLRPNPVEIARDLDPSKPLYITGHSLGAAIATVVAMELAIRVPAIRDQIRLYAFAGPRVGDAAFAKSFRRLVPNAYRIANIADVVPSLPPSQMGGGFVHVGQSWTFLANFGDIMPNHIADLYVTAVRERLETAQPYRGLMSLEDAPMINPSLEDIGD